MTIEFKVGQTYSTRSICDHNSIFSIEVVYRSPSGKTIKTACGKTLRVSVWEGVEEVMPCGRYSFAPTVTARGVAVDRSEQPSAQAESVADMLSGDEFQELFSPEEQGSILASLAAVLKPLPAAPKATAQVISLGDYRKRGGPASPVLGSHHES
jgi:hypothetical protein